MRFMIPHAAGLGACILFLAGCGAQDAVERERVQIIFPPYRYITLSPSDTLETAKQVERHNRTHAAAMKKKQELEAAEGKKAVGAVMAGGV